MRNLSAAAFLIFLAACSSGDQGPRAEPAAQDAAVPLAVESWPLPAPAGAAQPDLVRTPDGDLLLSWIAPDGDDHVLSFARWQDGTWSDPQPVARGSGWFVNWADVPHILATPDGALWAHWLQKSAAATYTYDVALVRSADDGASWSEPVLVNDDGTPTEHGFVSLWPEGGDSLGIAWLDGRETFAPEGAVAGHDGHGGGPGAMTLRSARFGPDLQRHDEVRIDGRVCDCCPTAVAGTTRGALLAYRDRSEEEVRDISVARLEGGQWRALGAVHDDGWEMHACPVNGPSITADGDNVVLAWYTAVGDVPQIRLARSTDAGGHFGPPVTVDSGSAVQGRVTVVQAGGAIRVLWMREDAGGQSLHLASYSPDLETRHTDLNLAGLQGRGRGTGFPRLVADGDALRAVWTDVSAGTPSLHGALIHPAAAR